MKFQKNTIKLTLYITLLSVMGLIVTAGDTVISDSVSSFNGINNTGWTKTDYFTNTYLSQASCDVKAYTNGSIYCGTDATGATPDGLYTQTNFTAQHTISIHYALGLWSTGNFTKSDISDWDTAYGWGDHASANYLDMDTYPNVDTDKTDDQLVASAYKTNNFTIDYYSIDSRYSITNFTTNYYAISSRFSNANYTALHTKENHYAIGIITVDNITGYQPLLQNSSNITCIGNQCFYNGTAGSGTTYTGGANISIVGNVLSINLSCERITGSADLCDGSDATGGDAFNPSTIDYVNRTMLDNNSVVRAYWPNVTYDSELASYQSISAAFGNANFSALYYAISSRYGIANFTAQYDGITSRYGTGNFTAQHTIGLHYDLGLLSTTNITSTQRANWDTAYGWGNHATQGYLKNNTVVTFTNITMGNTGFWSNGTCWFKKSETVLEIQC